MFNKKQKKIECLIAEEQKLTEQLYEGKITTKYWMEMYDVAGRDNQQLQYRYDLLESLLKQLRVNVTLPAKKVAKEPSA